MKKLFFVAAIAATALLASCNKPGATNTRLKTDVDTLSYALGMANSASDEEIKMYLTQAGADSTYVEEFFKGMKDGLNSSDDKKDMAYQLGLQTGMQMKTRMFPNVEGQVFAGDSTSHLSTKHFLAGMADGRRGKTALVVNGQEVDRQGVQNVLMELVGRMSAKANEKVYGEKKQASTDFMANVAKQPGVKALANGVYYKVVNEGKGDVPASDQTVMIEYEGRLMDGTVFDATQPGQPVSLACNQVVPGFATALTAMPVGSEWEVYLPYDQAYGEQGSGPIPPYSALVFKIKLVSIKAAE